MRPEQSWFIKILLTLYHFRFSTIVFSHGFWKATAEDFKTFLFIIICGALRSPSSIIIRFLFSSSHDGIALSRNANGHGNFVENKLSGVVFSQSLC